MVSEQGPEQVWLSIRQAKLDTRIPERQVYTPARLRGQPINDILGGLMNLAIRFQNAKRAFATVVTDSDSGVEAALGEGIGRIRRYQLPKWAIKSADIANLTHFHGFKLA